MHIRAYLFVFFITKFLFAYPEYVTQGYPNCTACHISPNGGGILTPYGRSLSAELISTWGTEKEGAFLGGAMTLPEWLSLTGDIRIADTYKDSPSAHQKAWSIIPMQLDAEAAFTKGRWTATGTFGAQNPNSANDSGSHVTSRSHAVIYHPMDSIYLRAGRFYPAFGFYQINHTLYVRKDLDFDEGAETYNLEASWLGESADLFVTAILGRPEAPGLRLDQGIALRSSLSLSENKKVGLSYLLGSEELKGTRHVIGPFGIIGITRKALLLAEVDYQTLTTPAASTRSGYVAYLKLNYEVFKGAHLGVTYQFSKLDLSSRAEKQLYGTYVQWFPYPHVEIDTQMQWYYDRPATDLGRAAWFLLHVYL